MCTEQPSLTLLQNGDYYTTTGQGRLDGGKVVSTAESGGKRPFLTEHRVTIIATLLTGVIGAGATIAAARISASENGETRVGPPAATVTVTTRPEAPTAANTVTQATQVEPSQFSFQRAVTEEDVAAALRACLNTW